MLHDPARGPEDIFDSDNEHRSAFMAEYSHLFDNTRNSYRSKGGYSSGWPFWKKIKVTVVAGIIGWLVLMIFFKIIFLI